MFEQAFCGQTARSPTPRRGKEDSGHAPEPLQGHNGDYSDLHQGQGRGEYMENLGGESDDGIGGEAGSILFASPSPADELSLRPPRDANTDANAGVDADVKPVREGRWGRPALLDSTGDGTDGDDVGKGEEVGFGVTVATSAPQSSTTAPGNKPRQEAGVIEGEKAIKVAETPAATESVETAGAAGEAGVAGAAETSGAAGAAETAKTAGAAKSAEPVGEARAGVAAGGAAGSIQAAESTEDAIEAEESRAEVRPGVAPWEDTHGSPSWGALTHPDSAEVARQGGAGASIIAGGRNPGRNSGDGGDKKFLCGKRRGNPGYETGGCDGGGSGGDANSAKVDTEWENEIAKNILSLYQTKLKDELDKKREARKEEAGVSVLFLFFVLGE